MINRVATKICNIILPNNLADIFGTILILNCLQRWLDIHYITANQTCGDNGTNHCQQNCHQEGLQLAQQSKMGKSSLYHGFQ